MFQRDRTNISEIESFDQLLSQYEASIPVQVEGGNYSRSIDFVRSALTQIVRSAEADTFSMMRRLVEHIQACQTQAYSEFTLGYLAANANDVYVKQLIMVILYPATQVVKGENPVMDDRWLSLIQHNTAIGRFLRNYAGGDQDLIDETYSGNIIKPTRTKLVLDKADAEILLEIGYASYTLNLTSDTPQRLSFGVAPDVHPDETAHPNERMVIVTDVIVNPTADTFVLNGDVTFLDDAAAQVNAMRCAPTGVVAGRDTFFYLPDDGYRLFMTVVSYNLGQSWIVTEVNILPPVMTY